MCLQPIVGIQDIGYHLPYLGGSLFVQMDLRCVMSITPVVASRSTKNRIGYEPYGVLSPWRWALKASRIDSAEGISIWLRILLVAFCGLLCPVYSDAQCVTPPNAIVAENCRPGNPQSEWDITGAGSPTIQGFATDISVNKGGTIQFKISTPATQYRLDIYRIGYYGGNGARKIATVSPSVPLPQTQPACLSQPATGLIDCGNWSLSAIWPVPSNATSGIYFAKLVREDGTQGASHIYFVVRDDSGGSHIWFKRRIQRGLLITAMAVTACILERPPAQHTK